MRVSLITQYYKPEMGAPQNRLYEMCVGLKKLGVDISIVTGMPNYPTGRIFKKYKGKFSNREIVDGIEVLRYWLYASNSRKILPRIWNMVSFSLFSFCSCFYLRKRKNDLIIVESPPLTLGVSGYFLSKLTGARLVMNISDLWPLSAKELGAINEEGFVYKCLEKLESFLYRNSISCLGQSQEIVDYMTVHGASKVYLFRNGVDTTRFNLSVNRPSRDSGALLQIYYTGLLGFAQGILGICENIDFHQLGAEFHIYGAGGEQEEIEFFLKDHPERGIVYHGKVNREEIPAILSHADCTLIPLIKNIFGAVPSKIYESMAAGLPIIFSGEGEGRKIVEECNIGWGSNVQDYVQLAENIDYVAHHRESLIEKAKNCRKCAEEKFNRPKQIEALYDYLRSLCD